MPVVSYVFVYTFLWKVEACLAKIDPLHCLKFECCNYTTASWLSDLKVQHRLINWN